MKDTRVVSRFSFFVMTTFVMIVLTVLAMFAVHRVARGLGFDGANLGGAGGGFAMVNLMVARVFVDRLLKRLGMSRSGVVIEGWRPSPVEGAPAPDDEVTLRYSPGLFLTCALFFFAMLALTLFLARNGQANGAAGGRGFIPWGIALFGGMGVLSLTFPLLVVLHVDPHGVTGRRTSFSVRCNLIPWDDVASCEIVTERDTFGNVAIAYPKFLDGSGKEYFPKLWQGLMYVPKADRDRLLRFLKHRFPKLDIDPWEL